MLYISDKVLTRCVQYRTYADTKTPFFGILYPGVKFNQTLSVNTPSVLGSMRVFLLRFHPGDYPGIYSGVH